MHWIHEHPGGTLEQFQDYWEKRIAPQERKDVKSSLWTGLRNSFHIQETPANALRHPRTTAPPSE
ncbi:hypothetical protein PHLCEN_2v8272 [Hermanssonia centrifuga]|uniref:Uncharacterized protein n=1 Tax=Hermanssonia centrifuga TaxID=98765 RepID=A0A2R6NU31_9APHY|nr:hypothetical protein PHLCEN_2v8272 [Hermanssonia centrifuga]